MLLYDGQDGNFLVKSTTLFFQIIQHCHPIRVKRGKMLYQSLKSK